VLARHGPVEALARDAWSRGLLVVGNGGEGTAWGAAWGATPAAHVALQQLPARKGLGNCKAHESSKKVSTAYTVPQDWAQHTRP
jgi:hypothetical protein